MLVIYGPTVTGKTDLALDLARKYNGEIISADSRQVYIGLDIGSGKITKTSNVQKHLGFWLVDGVKINGFDIVQAGENFNVSDFVKFCTKKISEIKKQNKIPIIAGGTGFYIKAYLEGMDFQGVTPNKELRNALSRLSAKELLIKLEKVDSKKAASLNQSDRNNPRRLIRALEVSSDPKKNKINISSRKAENYKIFGLTAPNEHLFKRADNWLKERLSIGLLDEVRNLIDGGVNPEWLMKLGLEYKWMVRILTREVEEHDAVYRLKGEIHALIRRQKTYFKQFKSIEILDITNKNVIKKLELACTHSRG